MQPTESGERENNREFSKKRAISRETACLNDRKINELSLKFPTCRNRELLYAEQGIEFREQGTVSAGASPESQIASRRRSDDKAVS